METEEPFKAPLLLPKAAASSSTDVDPEQIRRKEETVLPDNTPHSPVERAESEGKISIAHPTLHYTPPPWALIPEKGLGYSLEIVKNGAIVDCFDLDKRKHDSYVVIGRLPYCDIVLDHPSVSRYHCILQYGDDRIDKTGKGWHIYDMGSTHGSKANKNKLPGKQYVRVKVGYVFQFGGSTRIFSLLGPPDDCDAEWECSPTEMREKMQKKALEAKLAIAARKEFEAQQSQESEASDGIDWGMSFDEDSAPAVVDMELDAHLMEDREQYYQSDPKKALSKFFEREGFEMTFQLSEQGAGHTHKWLCAIELPIEINGVDRTYTAQAIVSTSKKDAQVQCALEACRILDAHGVLRGSNAKASRRKKDLEENDFYDEDDDEYLDRTGQIEKQREKRAMWAKNKTGEKVEKKSTYESLCKELEETRENIAKLKEKLDEIHAAKTSTNTGDSLDDYCRQLSEGHGVAPDMKMKTETSSLRQKLVALTHDAQRLEKLVKIAKPVALPELKVAGANSSGADKQAFLQKAMMLARKKTAVEKGPAMVMKTVEKVTKQSSDNEPFKPEMDVGEEDEDDGEAPAAPSTASRSSDSLQQPAQPAQSSSEAVEETGQRSELIPEKEEESSQKAEEAPASAPQVPEQVPREPDRVAVDSKPDKRQLSEEDATEAQKKKRRIRIRANRPSVEAGDSYGTGVDDDRYATWLPPENQSGDGKTALNSKFAGRY
ncbi:hypothetical protein Q1695_016277 [Nippostrongylus brasiliensis]|nr:hypothetical protein Q1695_016277 [Nippostrongylus brasiliensis]